jgi:hypothetical protein
MRPDGVRATAQHARLSRGWACGGADLDYSRSGGNQPGQELRLTFETLECGLFRDMTNEGVLGPGKTCLDPGG